MGIWACVITFVDKKGTYQKITVAYMRGGPKCSDPRECPGVLVEI
jgi:hypothetical protein